MSNCVQLVLSNPTPGNEQEFNRWYGAEHTQHGVTTPGISSGQRFRRIPGPWNGGKHEYLNIWELDDPAFTLAELAKARESHVMTVSPAIDMTTVQPPTMWRRARVNNAARYTNDSSSFNTLVFALLNTVAGQEQEFITALLHGGLAQLADQPGVHFAELLTLAEEQIRGNARKYRFGLLIELVDEARAFESLAEPLTSLPHLDSQSWMAPVFRPLTKRVTRADVLAVTNT